MSRLSQKLTTRPQVTNVISEYPEFYDDLAGMVADYRGYGCDEKTDIGKKCFTEHDGCDKYCFENREILDAWLLPCFQWLSTRDFPIVIRNKHLANPDYNENLVNLYPLLKSMKAMDLEIIDPTNRKVCFEMNFENFGNGDGFMDVNIYSFFANIVPSSKIRDELSKLVEDYAEISVSENEWINIYQEVLTPAISKILINSNNPFQIKLKIENFDIIDEEIEDPEYVIRAQKFQKVFDRMFETVFVLFQEDTDVVQTFINNNYDLGIPGIIDIGQVKFKFNEDEDIENNFRISFEVETSFTL